MGVWATEGEQPELVPRLFEALAGQATIIGAGARVAHTRGTAGPQLQVARAKYF